MRIPIGSPEVNRIIRKILSPVLRENGFSLVKTRNNWRWDEHSIWVMQIRALGNDFSGWPTTSCVISCGVFYPFIPPECYPFNSPCILHHDADGRLLPREHECHMRTFLHSTLNIDKWRKALSVANRAEAQRRDLWCIECDGSNLTEAVEDMKSVFLQEALPWYRRLSSMEEAFREVEQERDCFSKYEKALHFAQKLGDTVKYEQYLLLHKAEGERIGRWESRS
jgi:hypothetical protein